MYQTAVHTASLNPPGLYSSTVETFSSMFENHNSVTSTSYAIITAAFEVTKKLKKTVKKEAL